MKRHLNTIVICLTIFFFVIPFFWLTPGHTDLGGDNGRLYFLDPLWAIRSIEQISDYSKVYSLATIPYTFFLSFLKFLINSPTGLISFENGSLLALAFFSIYLCSKEILKNFYREANDVAGQYISMVSGVVYVGFITMFGWSLSLYTQNQIFLNPLLFFLLLRYVLTHNFYYGLGILGITIIYSANFGFGSMPQLFSFFPFACLFIFFYTRFILQKKIPWKGLIFIFVCFLGLHAYQLVPLVASTLDKSGVISTTYFSTEAIGNRGVYYFDFNHSELGKISLQLFQPSQWHGQTILVFLIPLIVFLGFLKKPSKLQVLLGISFAATLFLVSANITSIGVQLYRSLFYIPGFMMFRSFNEKWYYVYSFFFTLLFAASLYQILAKKRAAVVLLVSLCVIGSVGYRIYPFLLGQAVNTTLWQTDGVSSTFLMDPDLLESITYVRNLPDDGDVLTLPLTFPYSQIAYGKGGGAYVGISMVQYLAGRKDFPGFWTFGLYQKDVFNAFLKEDIHDLLQLFSLLNIRYIFYNSDSRIMDNFPGFPYVYPGSIISSKDQLPMIKDQQAYGKFFSSLPIKKVYEKGFYSIYEIDDTSIRPNIYIPEIVYSSQSELLLGSSFRSAYIDSSYCSVLTCQAGQDKNLPTVKYTKQSSVKYDVSIDLKNRKKPFLVILSEDYHPSWELKLEGIKNWEGITHISINGYANAWIIEPAKIGNKDTIKGTIYMSFDRYYSYGFVISSATAAFLVIWTLYMIVRRRYEKK